MEIFLHKLLNYHLNSTLKQIAHKSQVLQNFWLREHCRLNQIVYGYITAFECTLCRLYYVKFTLKLKWHFRLTS